jgi:hypothetical protein
MQMTYPTANLLLGGVGRPALKRVALPTSGRPFAWVRDALRSNTELQGNTATLVLERRGELTSENTSQGTKKAPFVPRGSESSDDEGRETSKPVFDPSIFE